MVQLTAMDLSNRAIKISKKTETNERTHAHIQRNNIS